MDSLKKYEAYFQPAKNGDMGKYQILYLAFVKQGLILCPRIAVQFGIKFYDREEVEIVLSETFLKFMDKFDSNKSKLSSFAELLIRNALNRYFYAFMNSIKDVPVSLDYVNDEGQSLLDTIESSDYESMVREIEYNEKIYKIASRSSSKNIEERKMTQIILLRLKGYGIKSICKKLKLTIGQYRYLQQKIKNDDFLVNINFDLK